MDVIFVVVFVGLNIGSPLKPVFVAELEADLSYVQACFVKERLCTNVSPVLPTFLELTESMADKPISHIVENVGPVNHEIYPTVEKDALRMQQ